MRSDRSHLSASMKTTVDNLSKPGGELDRDLRARVTSASDDVDLVTLLRTGDGHAIAALYCRYAPRMLGVALSILKNRTDAEDLVHDVFIEAWRDVESYRAARGSFRSWLLLRTRSRALDRLRRRATVRRHETTILASSAPVTFEDGVADELAKQLLAHRALAVLTPEQRAAIELNYFNGLSYSEIACQCGIPIGTVKSRLAAALVKLREKWDVLAAVDGD
jgi:RNA polymerase sigma-70 factor, ECF subfamily